MMAVVLLLSMARGGREGSGSELERDGSCQWPPKGEVSAAPCTLHNDDRLPHQEVGPVWPSCTFLGAIKSANILPIDLLPLLTCRLVHFRLELRTSRQRLRSLPACFPARLHGRQTLASRKRWTCSVPYKIR